MREILQGVDKLELPTELGADEWLDDGDEGFDVPVGMNHVETFQVLP